MTEWIKKQDPALCCLQGIHLSFKDISRLKMKEWKKILCKWKSKGGIGILTTHKIDFKSKTVTRDKEGHYIMIKGSVHQEDIIINI